MHFTVSSLLNVILLSGISVFYLWFLLRHQYFINRLSFTLSFICLGLLILRIFIPVEYIFTKSIYDKNVLPVVQNVLQHNLVTLGKHPFHVSHFLIFIWILGAIMAFFVQLFNYLNFYHFVRKSQIIQDNRIENILSRIINTQKKKKIFQIVHTEHIPCPMIIRLRNYYILLPEISVSDEELTYILKHEIAHAYHGDLCIKAFVNFLCILYWWNPLIHLLEIQMDKLLELRADYYITQKMTPSERIAYSECLVHIAKECKKLHSVPISLSFTGRKTSTLTQRIHFILEQRTKKNFFLSCMILFPFLLTIAFSYCLIFEPTHDMPPEDADGSVELTPENAYFIHVSEDCYHLYLDGKYWATVDHVDIGVDLPIYESEENLP
ncbi:MAG: M56 family metallopeptidase [Lachnospiraceae bacterium]|nr:M56 family metallopeptidase [Lachnospiraceae bacterium]